MGGCEYLIEKSKQEEVWACCAIGNSRVRKIVLKRFENTNVKFPVLIDPDVIFSDTVEIGEGSIICAGSILTVDVNIGRNVIINLDCTVGHDSMLSDYVTLYPSVNVSGKCQIGECAEIGTGANIIQGIKVGNNSVIGAGTVLINDVEEATTVVGVPGVNKNKKPT